MDIECENPSDGFSLAFNEFSARLGHYDTTNEDAQLLSELLPIREYKSVLDICCGFGRISGALSRLGYAVTGVDLSVDQIALAKSENPGPEYFVSDMRVLPDGDFDAAVNMYTSFGYFRTKEEDFAALTAWAASLRPGGRLIMEMADMDRARMRLNSDGPLTVRKSGSVQETILMDWDSGVFKIEYELNQRKLSIFTRLYEKEELAEMLGRVGFVDVMFFGDLARKPKKKSDNLVVLATRK